DSSPRRDGLSRLNRPQSRPRQVRCTNPASSQALRLRAGSPGPLTASPNTPLTHWINIGQAPLPGATSKTSCHLHLLQYAGYNWLGGSYDILTRRLHESRVRRLWALLDGKNIIADRSMNKGLTCIAPIVRHRHQ